MAATLKLTREGVGMELRRGTFDVLIDGDSVGSINWHDTVEVPVESGRHKIRIRAGRYSSSDPDKRIPKPSSGQLPRCEVRVRGEALLGASAPRFTPPARG